MEYLLLYLYSISALVTPFTVIFVILWIISGVMYFIISLDNDINAYNSLRSITRVLGIASIIFMLMPNKTFILGVVGLKYGLPVLTQENLLKAEDTIIDSINRIQSKLNKGDK